MKLDDAIKLALDGHALLFAGAGFSCKATNLNDMPFPVGGAFSGELCDEMGLPRHDDLSLVSDMYMSDPHFGISSIIKKLSRTFRFKTAGDHTDIYQTICGIPWKRIYTTNYDNLCESIMQSLGIAVTPNTLSDNTSDYFGQLTVVHLNGYIDRLTPDTLQKEFKLSSDSYLAEDFKGSPWLKLFTAELNAAQVMIFIGVSFAYDIDLQRIIANSDTYKDKIIFIDRPLEDGDYPRMANYYKSKFGEVYNIGVDGFANKIKEIKEHYTPFSHQLSFFSFRKVELKGSTADTPTSQDARELLRFGMVKEQLIPLNLSGSTYIFAREAESQMLHLLKSDDNYDCIVLISELANGKSCIMKHAAYSLLDAGTVFFFNDYTNSTIDELKEIVDLPGKKYIFIENYNFNDQLLRLFRQIDLRTNHIKLILSARTAIHETVSYKISKYTGISQEAIIELSVDDLETGDIDHLIGLLDHAGIWDNFRNSTLPRKRVMIRKQYDAHFQNVLLDLIKSEQVLREIMSLYEEVGKNETASKLLIGICISNLVNLDFSLNDLLSILEINLTQAIRQNTYIRQLVDFQGNTISVKSSVLCRYLISLPNLTPKVKDVLLRLNLNAEACNRPNRIEAIRNSLISSSNIGLIFPASDSASQKYMIEYYNALKTLDAYKNNQFFWLQFAMACMDVSDFLRAKEYLDISYEIVRERRIRFDAYQIDTQTARYYLESTIYSNNSGRAFSSFETAHKLLSHVVYRKHGQNHLVFKQVIKYKAFYEGFSEHFTNTQRNRMIQACDVFIDICRSYLLTGQRSKYQMRITDEAINSLSDLRQRLICDIGESIGH